MTDNTRILLTIIVVSGMILFFIMLWFMWQINYERKQVSTRLHNILKKIFVNYNGDADLLFKKPTKYERIMNSVVNKFCKYFNRYQSEYITENFDYTYSFINYRTIEDYLETHLDQDIYSEIKILTFKIEKKRIKDKSSLEHMYKKLVGIIHKEVFDNMVRSGGRLKSIQFLTPLFPKYKDEIVEFEIFYVYNRNISKLVDDFSWR